MARFNTYLNFAGNAEEAFSFYRSVFGGDFSSFVRFKDFPMEGVSVPENDQGKIMHIALPIGDTVLMASDAIEAFGQNVVQGNNVYVSLQATTKEEADALFEGLSQGADIETAIADQPWGDYFGSLKDKFGIQWMVSYSPPRQH